MDDEGRVPTAGRLKPLCSRIVIGVLLLVGIAEPVGLLASLPQLRAVGRLTSASNSPLVFNQVGGIEFWASRYEFEFHGQDGTATRIPITNEVISRIKGPHTRTAAYVVPVGMGAIAPPEVYLPPLQFGLCRNGPLARDVGFPGAVSKVTIRIESGSPGDLRRWAVEVPCL